MKLGFTGTQTGMTERQKAEFLLFIKCSEEITEFHHGDCIGADKEACEIISANTKALIVRHPPNASYKRAWFRFDITMPEKPHLERNKDIVDAVDMMVATPKEDQEILRSGTWATIRYARKTGKKLLLLAP